MAHSKVPNPFLLSSRGPSTLRPLPFELLVDRRVFFAVELPVILPTEAAFIDSLSLDPHVASIALDIIGFERRFLADLGLLCLFLAEADSSIPELSRALLVPLNGIGTAHRSFLSRLESVVALRNPGFVMDLAVGQAARRELAVRCVANWAWMGVEERARQVDRLRELRGKARVWEGADRTIRRCERVAERGESGRRRLFEEREKRVGPRKGATVATRS
jgi:hypothetical protein